MEILFMVFMVIVSIMALFAVMVVFRDIVREILEGRREKRNANKSEETEVAEAKEAPVEEPVVEEAPVEEAPAAADDSYESLFKEVLREFLFEKRESRLAASAATEPTPVVEEPVEEPVVEEPVVEEPVVEEPVVEEAPVEEAPAAQPTESPLEAFFRSVLVDYLNSKDQKSAATEPAPAPVVEEPVVAAAPAVEEAPVEEAPAVEETVEEADGTISFSTNTQQTLEQKYLALTNEQKEWYDEIVKYASNVEGSKHFKNIRYEEYKVGKNRLVRLLIKRGTIHCEFLLQNSDFKNYISENKIAVKQSATTILVESAATLGAVKNSIDIAVAAIAEEKEYKKKLAREKRKARAAGETPVGV